MATDITKYNEFINKCRNKDYGELLTHKHHVMPKFMGGVDSELVELSYEDHMKAHEILAECYPDGSAEYIGNMASVKMLSMWWVNGDDDVAKKIGKKMRGVNSPLYGRKRPDHSKVMSGVGNPMYGKKRSLSKETRELIGVSIKMRNEHLYPLYDGVTKCDVIINGKRKRYYKVCSVVGCENITYYSCRENARVAYHNKSKCPKCASSGKKVSKESKELLREAALGRKHSDDAKRKMSKQRKGSLNSNAKCVKDLETGKMYDTVKELLIDLSISNWKWYRKFRSMDRFQVMDK